MPETLAQTAQTPKSAQGVPVPCNLCGGDDWKVLYRRVSEDASLNDFTARMTTDVYNAYGQIVKCRRCGLVYTNPRVEDAEVLSAYAAMEDHDYVSEQDCRSINAHLCMQLIKRHKNGGRLLDIGCSTGFFLNAARVDFEAHGVEPSHWGAEFAKKRLKLDVVEGTLETAGYPKAHFDVITLIDVIEHVTDPKAVLLQVRELLKPGGVLYLVTPDIDSLSAKLLRSYWWGLRPAHIYYYSQKTMAATLEAAGFKVVESRSYGRIFTYGYWLSRLKNYPAFFSFLPSLVIRLLGISEKVVYINTRDSMELCAVKN